MRDRLGRFTKGHEVIPKRGCHGRFVSEKSMGSNQDRYTQVRSEVDLFLKGLEDKKRV